MRRIALLLAALCIATPALARGRYNGVCAKSGAVQFGSIGPSTSTAALTYPLSTATIYQSDGVTPATIYSDNSGTPKANPFTTGSDGSLFFYADNGSYNVQCSGTGIGSPFTFPGVIVVDPTTVGGAWGSIAGVLSSQTDLQNALNSKISTGATSTGSLPSPATAGKLYLLSSGFENFLVDNGSFIWNVSNCNTHIAAWADPTGANNAVTGIQNAIQSVNTSTGQRLCFDAGTYQIGTATVPAILHINREGVYDGGGSGENSPTTTFQLGPKSYIVVDRPNTSPDGGRGDWSVLSNFRIVGTTISCTATSGNATLASCNSNPATALNLSAGDPIVAMGLNGPPWSLAAAQGTTVSSLTSSSIVMSTTATFSGTVTVMAGGPLVGTGTSNDSSKTVTGITGCSSWMPGDPITGPGIVYPNFVTATNCVSNTLTLFSNATSAATIAPGLGSFYKSPLPNLMVKAPIRMAYLMSDYSAGHGVDINASTSYSPSTNSNGDSANQLRITHAGGLDFHLQGADVNAFSVDGLYMAYGAEGCYRSDSFLGGVSKAGECASQGGPGWSTTGNGSAETMLGPYQEGGYTINQFSSTTLVLGGTNASQSVGGNVISSAGVISPTFTVDNYSESTATLTNNSSTLTNVTNISHWNVGDTIVGYCLDASATVGSTDGVSSITLAGGKQSNCTGTGVPISHENVRMILGTQGGLKSAGGFGLSYNKSSYFNYENIYNEYFDTNEWGWICQTWRNSTKALCYATDQALGKDQPPNSGSGSIGNNGGQIKFPQGCIYLGSGANADAICIAGTAPPTTGWYSKGSIIFPATPTLSSGAAYIQTGAGKSFSSSVTATTAIGSTTISSTSSAFQTGCAPNDWVTGTGIENDTIIISVNTGATSAVLSRPATAAGTPTLTCGKLAKAHPSTIGTTNNTTTITGVSPTSSFANNDPITAADIPANTYVVSGGGTATIVISQAATGANAGESLSDPTSSFAQISYSQVQQLTTAGTSVTNGTCQAQTTMTFTGASTSTSTVSWGYSSTPVATWQTGITVLPAVTAANTVIVYLCNPTSGSITPAAATLNIRVHF